MHSVTAHEAKTNLSKLIEEALESEEVVISRGAPDGSIGSNRRSQGAAPAWCTSRQAQGRSGVIGARRDLTDVKYDSKQHHRRSIRLRGYDYSSPGAYFITICTDHKQFLFGEVRDEQMHRNGYGEMVQQE